MKSFTVKVDATYEVYAKSEKQVRKVFETYMLGEIARRVEIDKCEIIPRIWYLDEISLRRSMNKKEMQKFFGPKKKKG